MNSSKPNKLFNEAEKFTQVKADLEEAQKDLYQQRKKIFYLEQEVKRLQKELWTEENKANNGSLILSSEERKRDKIFTHIKTAKCTERISGKTTEIKDFEIIKKAARWTGAHLFQITEWEYIVENENSDIRYSFVIDF